MRNTYEHKFMSSKGLTDHIVIKLIKLYMKKGETGVAFVLGSRDGAVIRTHASHQCGLDSITGLRSG